MPSRFPGMDPYLERPNLWPDVHNRLIAVASDLLVAQLRPRYFVRIEERVYVSDEGDPGRHVIGPDLRIVQASGSPGSQARASDAVAEPDIAVAEPIDAKTVIEDEVHEPRLEIIDTDRQAVITVVEILSPANKVNGSRGRESYQQKRHEVIHSPSHFVEIDLLRRGERFPFDNVLPRHDYLAHVSKAERRPRGLLWAIRVEQRLPTLPVPLRGGDAEVRLNLQEVLDVAYDRAAYDLQIDYRREPIPPLEPEQSQWADARLRAKGLR